MAKRDVRLLTLRDTEDPEDPDLPISSYDVGVHSYVMGQGMVPLVQAFLTNLITDEGSAELSPDRGGGLFRLLGRYREFDSSLQSEVTSRIRSVEESMIQEQQERTMSPKEKLERVDILDISQGDRPDQITVQLAIYSQAGEGVSIRL